MQERRVRNTLEKTFALQEQGLSLTHEDLKNSHPDDYIRLFTQYLGQLLGYFARYIHQGRVDFARDKVLFEMFPLYLSEAEIQAFSQALNMAMGPYLNNTSSPERRRLIIGLMSIPDVGGAVLPDASIVGQPVVESNNLQKE